MVLAADIVLKAANQGFTEQDWRELAEAIDFNDQASNTNSTFAPPPDVLPSLSPFLLIQLIFSG